MHTPKVFAPNVLDRNLSLLLTPYTPAFREGIAKEIGNYLDHCKIEQKQRLTGETAPDFGTYMATRLYTSAVRVYCYITQ